MTDTETLLLKTLIHVTEEVQVLRNEADDAANMLLADRQIAWDSFQGLIDAMKSALEYEQLKYK